MKPFSTPVLSKRTYRELKLLKHLRHENVCAPAPSSHHRALSDQLPLPDYLPERHFHFPAGGYVCMPLFRQRRIRLGTDLHRSYFVTELLGTDLHRLLTSRPLEKQFIQYFLYQILVRRLAQFSYGLLRVES